MADEQKVQGDVELDDEVMEDVSGGIDDAANNNNNNNNDES